jgi:hypothetical protein
VLYKKADGNSKSENGLPRYSGLVKNKLEVVEVMTTNTKSRLDQSKK